MKIIRTTTQGDQAYQLRVISHISLGMIAIQMFLDGVAVYQNLQ